MELFDEELEQNKNKGNKKTATIILVVIIILLIIVTTLVGVIFYLKNSTLSVSLNGQTNQQIKDMLIIDEDDNSKVYIPIKQIASYLGYESFSGNYTTKSEETNQCYVQCEDEVAMFTLNSKVLYKTMPATDSDYEYFYIDEPVIARNNELYTTMDGIEKAFNVTFDYDVENQEIQIYTMPYLISFYSNYILDYGYSEISEDFTNQKTVLDDMLVVVNEKGKMGVIQASTGDAILEVKYDNVEYLQHTSDFLVVDSNKMGIISKNKRTKVSIQYDNIELMDYDAALYVVEQDDKFGVMDFNGNIIINIDYQDIGIDASKFTENDIKNGYILVDNLIPVQDEDGFWGFFDTSGNQITECKYDSLGYVATNNQAGYSLIVIPDYNVIVVEKDDKYTLLTSTGEEIWDFFPFDSVYLSKTGGTISYNMLYNSEVLDATVYLDNLGYGKVQTSGSSSSSQNESGEDSTNTTQTNVDETNTEDNQEEEQQNQDVDNQENTESEEN